MLFSNHGLNTHYTTPHHIYKYTVKYIQKNIRGVSVLVQFLNYKIPMASLGTVLIASSY